MNKYIVAIGALAFTVVGSLSADTDTVKTTKSSTQIVKKSTVTAGPVNRTLEVRVGPRVSWLTGDVRVGRTGTVFNVEDDLGLDDPNAGIRFDFDYQPFNRIHLEGGISYDIYHQSGTTTKNITVNDNTVGTFLSGGKVSTDTDIAIYDVKLGYEVIKTNTYRLKPYVGAIGGYAHGSGRISGQTTGFNVPTATRTFSDNFEGSYITFMGGLDNRLFVSRSWYLGVDAAGYAWDNVGLIHGQAYTGYDFSKAWGLRVGYMADYVTYQNSINSQKMEPFLGAVYLQVVAGF